MLNSSSGTSACCLEDGEEASSWLFTAAILTLASLVIVINGVVAASAALVAHKNPGRMKATYMLLASLATSDTLTGVALFIAELIPLKSRTLGICLIILGSVVSAQLASAFLIVLIGIDRYILIACPFEYFSIVTSKRVKCVVAATFFFAFIIGFLPAFGWRSSSTSVGKPCSYITLAAKECVFCSVIIGIILPLSITIVINSLLFRHAKRFIDKRNTQLKPKVRMTQERSLSEHATSVCLSDQSSAATKAKETDSEEIKATVAESSSTTKAKEPLERRFSGMFKTLTAKSRLISPDLRRTATTIFLLVGAYCFTTLPFFIGSIMSALTEDPQKKHDITDFTDKKLSFLAFLNSLLNPLLYAWWHKEFRQGVIRTVTRKFSSKSVNDSINAK